MTKEAYLEQLAKAVLNMDDEAVVPLAEAYLADGYPALDGIMEGLVAGMNEASRLYDEEEYFITDILLCSDAMYAGLDVLKPHLAEGEGAAKATGIIGVVEGDTHDIGKNLVKIMLETAGFHMIDLGRDVKLQDFVETAKTSKASLLCMSTLMTTTMNGMEKVIGKLREEGLRDQIKVMIGGGPISSKFAEIIGADAYTANAIEAVRTAKHLLKLEA